MIKVGSLVATNYNTGPYRVTHVGDVCTCPEYVRSLNGDKRPSKPHYHFTCRKLDNKGGDHYLGGFTLEGKSVWCRDRVIVLGGVNLELF